MLALITALFSAAAAPVPGLYDPILYPPEVVPEDPVTTGEVRVEGGGALVLRHTEVIAEVHAGLARVTLIQQFQNPYEEPIEAKYLFPLPAGAAVDRMDLTVGDRTIEGWVMERQAALQTYEAAKEDGRRAALLEQERDNLFTQHIAGICPGEHISVTLQYTEQLEYEDSTYTWSFPMTVGPRYSPPWVTDAGRLETPYGDTGRTVDLTVYLDEGMAVESLWSDTHDIDVPWEDDSGAQVNLVDEASPDRDFVLSWTLAGHSPRAAVLAHRPRADAPGYLALTVEPQILDDLFVARPRELLFVVDASGSMRGWPYESARSAVLMALADAGPEDTFNLVSFSDAASSLFRRPQRVTPETVAAARAWLSNFQGGGTHMDAGILHTLDMPGDPEALRLVLFLTDGFVGGEDRLFELVRDHRREARLFALGVGSSVNRYLLEGLAEMGKGDVIYHLPGEPLEKAVDEFHDRIAHPAMSDIEVDWGPEVIVEDAYPERIPDLWAGQPLRLVARYEGSGPTEVTVTGVVGREEIELTLPVVLPERELHHEGLAALWARRRIRDLEWYPRGRTPDQVRNEVIDVALDHNLVSTYTSLVAVDDEPSPCGAASLQVHVPNEAPHLAPGAAEGLGGLGTLGYGGGGCGYGGGVGYGVGSAGLSTRSSAQAMLSGSSASSVSFALGATGSGHGGGGLGSTAASPDLRVGSYGRGSSARVTTASADPIILGSIDRTIIDDVIRRHRNQLRYCYERALRRDSSLAGEVVIRFTIAEDGTVAEASVDRSTIGDANLEPCLLRQFQRMQFPTQPGGGEVVVRYPLRFSQ